MENIICMLERIGADGQLRHDKSALYSQQQQLDPQVQQLLADGNIEQLEKLLNVRQKIVCMIFPVEEPAEQPDDKPDDKPEDSKQAIAV